jgi:hypothetical protein
LARVRSGYLLIGLEPACGISERVAKQALRDQMNRGHQEYWKSIPGQKHVMGFLGNPPPEELWNN